MTKWQQIKQWFKVRSEYAWAYKRDIREIRAANDARIRRIYPDLIGRMVNGQMKAGLMLFGECSTGHDPHPIIGWTHPIKPLQVTAHLRCCVRCGLAYWDVIPDPPALHD